MRSFKALRRDRTGAAAIEFALLALPFFLSVFAILDVAIMYFVDSGLDAALEKSARQVRVGEATDWELGTFKEAVCEQVAFSFDCSEELLVRASVISDMSSVAMASVISGGVLSVTEAFDVGESGDYVLIQAYLPFTPALPFYTYSTSKLDDGRYVLGATQIFKNEPF
ncbi:pilus assembly protein [Rhizobium sp. TRM95111]|uniref:TadE/TadG family type IV pilus assembly protein n=1 Tax=Rhizobium alarense TaxID=2846851 RepID=UPI001F3B39A1|nr:TadE/TadG family type IV pilus assembly protein [Rhizobium alarense]MCF3642782.1 pilus assembly protein [Rhizobium alarense]